MRVLAGVLLLATTAFASERPGWLGLGLTVHRDGAQRWMHVRLIVPGSPAEKAGFRVDEIITAIDGKPLRFHDDLDMLEHLGRIRSGQRVRFTVVQQGKTTTRTLVAAEMTDAQHERWKFNLEHARQKRIATAATRQ